MYTLYTVRTHCTVYTLYTLASVHTLSCVYADDIGIGTDVIGIGIGIGGGTSPNVAAPTGGGGIDEREPETGGPIYKPRYSALSPSTDE